MNGRKTRFALLTAGLVLLVGAGPAGAVQNGDQAFKCELSLWKSFKLELFTEKFFGKCLIDYEKRNLFLGGQKGKNVDPDDAASAIQKSAELCNSFIGKAQSVVDAGADTAGCSAANYQALGAFDQGTLTADLVAMDALRAGLRRVSAHNRDMWTILDTMANSATGCAQCADFADDLFDAGIGPCAQAICALGSGSTVTVVTDLLADIAVPVTGAFVFDVCSRLAITGPDYFLYSGPSRANRATITGFADVCVGSAGAVGFIAGPGSSLVVGDVEVCQDHLIGGTCSVTTTTLCLTNDDCPATETCTGGDSDECIAGGSDLTGFLDTECAAPDLEGSCTTSTASRCNEDAECPTTETCDLTASPAIHSGACARLANTGTATVGESLLNLVLVNKIVTDAGTDTIPCTPDDDTAPPAPVALTFTTESADGVIYDRNRGNNTVVDTAAVSGSDFTVLSTGGVESLESGRLDGIYAGIFPALSLNLAPNVTPDALIPVRLECETP